MFELCARFQFSQAVGPSQVPSHLFPNQTEKARDILDGRNLVQATIAVVSMGGVRMACVCLEKCPFFNDKMADMPSMSDLLKDRYCRGEWGECARYRVFKVVGRENVPIDLYPAQADKADALIASA